MKSSVGVCRKCGVIYPLREGVCSRCREKRPDLPTDLLADAIKAELDLGKTRIASPGMEIEKDTIFRDVTDLGKYTQMTPIGKGGMGEVFKAWDNHVKRWVALKFLSRDSDPDIARFKLEARTVGKLNHPNIASLYEIGEMEGRHFIALQFIDGTTLDAVPREQRLLASLVRDAAFAIHSAHEEGIIHRDLKPANLMVEVKESSVSSRSGVENAGEGYRVYVMDFGLAKNVQVESSLSATGMVLGTPAYMSPEQAQGKNELVDVRSDVYSLGVTLYQVLCGQLPFDTPGTYELLKRVIEFDPPRLRKRSPNVAPDLETIVYKCMEKEPARRYASAGELAEDLDRWLKGEAIQAHPPSTLYRVRKFLGREKALVSVAIAGLLAILLVGGGLSMSRSREIQAEFQEATVAAEEAFARKDWSKVLFESRRAMKIREDARMEELEERSSSRLLVEEKIRPLEQLIRDTRPYFYIPGFDFRLKLDQVIETLETLSGIMNQPENGDYAKGWKSLGMGLYFVGDRLGSKAALLRAEREGLEDAKVNWYLGKIYLEDSLSVISTEPQDVARRIAEELLLARTALSRFQKGNQEDTPGMPRDISEASLALLEKRNEDLLRVCDEGLRNYEGKLGREEFLLLLGISPERKKADRIDSLRKALEIRPHYARAFLALGHIAYESGEYDKACSEWTRAIKINPRNARAFHARGSALKMSRKREKAVEDYSTSIELDPSDHWVWYSRGITRQEIAIHGKKDEVVGAIEDFTMAVKLAPEIPQVRFARAGCYLALAVLIGGDGFGKAHADLDRVIELDPKLPDAHNMKGIIYRQRGDMDRAVIAWKKALEIAPQGWAQEKIVRNLLVTELMKQGANLVKKNDLDGALEVFDELIRLDPELSIAWNRRGVIHFRKGQYKKAIADFTREVKLDPGNAMAWYNRGWNREKLGDLEGALKDLTRSVELAKDPKDKLAFRGYVYAKAGQRKKAIADFTKVLELDPGSNWAYYQRGFNRAKTGDVEGSIEDYRKALEVAPRDWKFRKNLQAYLDKYDRESKKPRK